MAQVRSSFWCSSLPLSRRVPGPPSSAFFVARAGLLVAGVGHQEEGDDSRRQDHGRRRDGRKDDRLGRINPAPGHLGSRRRPDRQGFAIEVELKVIGQLAACAIRSAPACRPRHDRLQVAVEAGRRAQPRHVLVVDAWPVAARPRPRQTAGGGSAAPRASPPGRGRRPPDRRADSPPPVAPGPA